MSQFWHPLTTRIVPQIVFFGAFCEWNGHVTSVTALLLQKVQRETDQAQIRGVRFGDLTVVRRGSRCLQNIGVHLLYHTTWRHNLEDHILKWGKVRICYIHRLFQCCELHVRRSLHAPFIRRRYGLYHRIMVAEDKRLGQGSSTRGPPNVFVRPPNKFWISSVNSLIQINKCEIKFILKYFNICTNILNCFLFFICEISVNVVVNSARLQ
jgi:hypothetical protein